MFQFWEVAEMEKAPVFEIGSRWFKSNPPSQSLMGLIFALEAHQDEHPAFNRRAVGSIPIGRTKVLRGCRQDGLSRQTFNLEIAGSNPANLTMPVSFTGLGSFATNEEKVVQFHSRVPITKWWPSGKGTSLSMRTRWVQLPSTSPS